MSLDELWNILKLRFIKPPYIEELAIRYKDERQEAGQLTKEDRRTVDPAMIMIPTMISCLVITYTRFTTVVDVGEGSERQTAGAFTCLELEAIGRRHYSHRLRLPHVPIGIFLSLPPTLHYLFIHLLFLIIPPSSLPLILSPLFLSSFFHLGCLFLAFPCSTIPPIRFFYPLMLSGSGITNARSDGCIVSP